MWTNDRARRCSDTLTLAWEEHGLDAIDHWMAIRLSDGGSDNKIYDTKADAVRHQLYEKQCAYLCVKPGGMLPEEAMTFLEFVEGIYDKGYDMADPDIDYRPGPPVNPLFRGAVNL
jgi:hypothetical protein